MCMRMRRAPASSEFSSSSLTTEAGRSTTSPAAILLATCSGRTWIFPMGQAFSRLAAMFSVSRLEFLVASEKGGLAGPGLHIFRRFGCNRSSACDSIQQEGIVPAALNLINTELSDEQVVERVLEGDTALFEIIMRRYNQCLYRVALAITRNEGEAED